MKKCIIIDDEQNARETLQKMIIRYFPTRVNVVGMSDSVKSAVELIKENKPDMVFLDIEMPEENGLELFSYFKEIDFSIVFTTAYQQYAINAIKYAALDYILKPISQIELGAAITKLEKKDKANRNTTMHIEALLHNINLESENFNKIMLPTRDGYELEKIRNIMYCKADKNYCEIYTVSNIIIVSKPLKYVVELLPKELFFRIHKSYYVNQNYIKSLSRTDGDHLVLENNTNLPISSGHYKELVEKMS